MSLSNIDDDYGYHIYGIYAADDNHFIGFVSLSTLTENYNLS